MRSTALWVGLLLCGAPALADTGTDKGNPAQKVDKLRADLPTGVKLVATSQASEVRAFPELNKDKGAMREDVVGVGATDNVYESSQPYKDAVAFYDGRVRSGNLTQRSRTVTNTSTAWELKLPSGELQNVIVRNTQPTTIEVVRASSTFERHPIQPTPTP